MGYNEVELPEEVWSIIAQYADVLPQSFTRVADSGLLGLQEGGRRLAAQAEAKLGSSLMGCVLSRTRLSIDWPYAERVLWPRAQFQEYAGVVDHCVAMRASLLEYVATCWFEHQQHYPMAMGLVGVDDLDPPFAAGLEVDAVMRPSIVSGITGVFMANPWTFRYQVRPIALGGQEAEETVVSDIKRRRCLVTHLKAHMLLLMMAGSFPQAYAEGVLESDQRNKYEKLLCLVVGALIDFWHAVLGVVVRALGRVDFYWYTRLSPEVQAVLDVTLIAAALVVAYRVHRSCSLELPLVVTERKGSNVYLGQIASDKGIIHRVRINGREISLSAFPEMDGSHQEEMAMPGSEYFPCKAQPIGAILVTTNNTDLQLFGTFWRMDEYLVTARHCSNTLNQSTAVVYLAPIRATRKGNYEVDRANVYKVPDDFFSPECNVIASYDIDAFARELEEKTWSQIKLTKASTKVRSAYNQQVHTVGFTPDGLLVSASGKTLPDSGYEHLHHTASTQKGFSGSILLCGNSVVGMHVSAAGEHNVAVRTEMIQYLIDVGTGLESVSKNRKKYSYADASYKEHYRQHKWRGGVVSMKAMRDGKYAIVLQNGEATYGWSMRDVVDTFGTGNAEKDYDTFEDLLQSASFASRYGSGGSRGQYIDYDDERYHRNDFENVSVRSMSKGRRKKTARAVLPKDEEDMSWLYTVSTGHKPVHGPSAPKVQPEATQVIEEHKDRLVNLGYEEGAFALPQMTPQEEKLSLVNHLKLFGERVRSATLVPTESELKRCSTIVASMMSANTFMPDADYRQTSGILGVIHSSIIQADKSSGYPYVAEGMPTNGLVLAKYGEAGFAQHVLNEWDSAIILKMFEKGEPTKLKKLLAGMPRCIAGMPLHATVKHASIFKNFAMSLVKNFKRSPVKFAFSPANPGHLEHLKAVLPGAVWESDKSNWDFSMLAWIVEVCSQVVCNLAVRNPEWSDEQFEEYKLDVRRSFDQVFKNSQYRTSDGTLFEMVADGIMKSGWFCTIAVNSVAQLVIHVMILTLMGFDDEEIQSLAIVVGGDDVNQEPGAIDREAYVAMGARLGVVMEIHERECLEQSEFFSSDIRQGPEGLEFHPKRWTKHVEHLKTIKVEHLADALCSHMENYRHSPDKFRLLEDMYHRLRESHPGHFLIEKLKSRDFLLAKQYGYEHALM